MPSSCFWWLKQLLLTLLALFFLFFGISLLVSAYRLNNPFSFVMTFFGASLMTLISATMVLGFVVKMMTRRKTSASGEPDPEDSSPEMKNDSPSQSPDELQ